MQVLKLYIVSFWGRCALMGNTLRLPSPTKLARLGYFPPASQAGRLAAPVFYVYVFSLGGVRGRPPGSSFQDRAGKIYKSKKLKHFFWETSPIYSPTMLLSPPKNVQPSNNVSIHFKR
jgi:hypothetical protein